LIVGRGGGGYSSSRLRRLEPCISTADRAG
jgi:hypothetical protein